MYIKMYIWRKYSIGCPIQTINLYPQDAHQPRLKFLMEALEVDHLTQSTPKLTELLSNLTSHQIDGQHGTCATVLSPDSPSGSFIFADYVPHYFEQLARSPSPSYVVVNVNHAATTTHDTIIKK